MLNQGLNEDRQWTGEAVYEGLHFKLLFATTTSSNGRRLRSVTSSIVIYLCSLTYLFSSQRRASSLSPSHRVMNVGNDNFLKHYSSDEMRLMHARN